MKDEKIVFYSVLKVWTNTKRYAIIHFQWRSNACYGLVVQLVRTPPCHGGGHGFESRSGRLFYALNESEGKVNRGLSSAGRAPALQAGGHRFEPCRPQLFSKDDVSLPMWLNWQSS